MAITIPPVPTGIENPNDLYNGDYNELPDLEWSNRDFHAKIGWIMEQYKTLLKRDISIAGWAAARVVGPMDTRLTSTHAAFVLDDGRRFDADCRNIMQTPMSVLATLYELSTGKWLPQVAPYPGLEALHPDTNPIGAPWPEHPMAINARKFFHPATGDQFPVGATFESATARYVKMAFLSGAPQGPFGWGAKIDYAWEQVYTR